MKQFLGLRRTVTVGFAASRQGLSADDERPEIPSVSAGPVSKKATRRRRSLEPSEQHGWDAYRKWLSRVSTKPTGERTPLDHSIYSWRGYHTWADKVRQNWKDG